MLFCYNSVAHCVLYSFACGRAVEYDTIEEFNVDSKAEYTA